MAEESEKLPQKDEKREYLSRLIICLLIALTALIFIPWERLGSDTPSEGLLFLGRFHPTILHFPIGFIMAVFILEFCILFFRAKHFEPAAFLLFCLTTLAAISTASLGVLLSLEGGYDSHVLFLHRATGMAVAVSSVWALVIKIRARRTESIRLTAYYRGILLVMVILMVTAGHHGGSLTHGSNYLFHYMPEGLRRVAGKEPRGAKKDKPERSGDAKPIFAGLIMPIVQARCIYCHNDEKQKGDLNLTSYEAMMKGGKSGKVVTAGKPEKSKLYLATTYPIDEA